MSKVILVMEDPMFCLNCPLSHYRPKTGEHYCAIAHKTDKDYYWEKVDMDSEVKPDWCPLITAPVEQEAWNDDDEWIKGYNNCVCEIMGE